MRKILIGLIFYLSFFVFLPVSVFAATYTAGPTVDTSIASSNPNKSGDDDAWLSLVHVGNTESKILIKFATPNISKCSKINFANVEIWENGGMGTAVPAQLDLAPITSNWDGNVTWNTKPSVGVVYTGISEQRGIEYKLWQVREPVQDWLAGKPNYGVVIYYAGPADKSVIRTFDSSKDGNAHKPILRVDYTPPAAGTFCPQDLVVQISPFKPVVGPLGNGGNNNQALSISDVKIEPAANTATITWKTNKSANSFVYYGNAQDNVNRFDKQTGQGDLTTAHSVILKNLTAGNKYSFKVMSEDSGAVPIFGPITTFTTSASQVVVSPSPTAEPNPISSVGSQIEDSVAEFVIENSTPAAAQATPAGTTQNSTNLTTSNPLVLFAGIAGTNRVAGVMMIILGILSLTGAYLVFIAGRRVHKSIKRVKKKGGRR